MKKKSGMLPIILLCCLTLSVPTGCQTPLDSIDSLDSNQQVETAKTTNSVFDYLLPVNDYFKVQSVKSEHQPLIDKLVEEFESDLEGDNLDDYYQLPDFSIQLLSGSEGSYFNSNQDLTQVASTDAAFAQALIIGEDQSTQIFKGQFTNQRFYFQGNQTFSQNNTTYLITLDHDLQTQVYSGQLLAQSEGSYVTEPESSSVSSGNLPQNTIPQTLPVTATPTPLATPTPSATPTPQPPKADKTSENYKKRASKFALALSRHQRHFSPFALQVKGMPLVPPPPPPNGFPPPPPPNNNNQMPPPPPPMNPLEPILMELAQVHPEVQVELDALKGLPPQEHGPKIEALYEKYKKLYPEFFEEEKKESGT